ncbi:MAG: TrkH family potassium uptake protein [Myxococcota bacterium]
MRNRFNTLNIVFNSLGSLFIFLSVFLLIPLFFVFFGNELSNSFSTLYAFLGSSILSLILGIIFKTVFKGGTPDGIQAMLICVMAWLGFSAIGAITFVVGIEASYLDGFFETMSGFTTTGITMFSGLDKMPRSIIFWRALTQFIGGLGILTFFVFITSQGKFAHRLFGAESHKISSSRPVPGLQNTVKILWVIYAGLTLFIALALVVAGMSLFDSFCHSFTALSTGGFSPHDASIEYYRLSGHSNYIWIEYILILGMLFGGINFLIHYRLLKRDGKPLWDNLEMRYFWSIIGIFLLIMFLERVFKVEPFNFSLFSADSWLRVEEEFRLILFQITSILTTTGFGTRDIGTAYFGQAAKQLFLILMIIGGCVGSTGGGIKVLRIGILFKLIQREVYKILAPRHAVNKVIIDGKAVGIEELQRVSGLFFI